MSKIYKSHPVNPIETYEIVIIEDDEGLNHLISKNLKRQGFKCIQAFNGEKAVEVVNQAKDPILILDYKLPDINGKQVIQSIQEKYGHTPPFIVMTGFGDEKIAVEMMKRGARDYIIKDSDFIEILSKKLEQLVEELKKNKENERYQKLLQNTERLAGVGGWLWFVKSDKWIMSDNWLALHGCSEKSLATDELLQIAHPEDAETISKAITKTAKTGEPYLIEHRIIRKDNHEIRHIKAYGEAELDDDGNVQVVSGAAMDVTDRIIAEKKEKKLFHNLQTLWELTTFPKKDVIKLTDHILQEIITISESQYAFYGIMDEKEHILTLYSWSENVMKDCEIKDKPYKFPIRNAGIWAEAVRKKKTLVINNYQEDLPGKMGVPKGHVPIRRLVSIPVIDRGKVVAIAAVANKKTDYTKEDLAVLETFLSNAYTISLLFQTENALKQSEAKFRGIFENAVLGIFRSTPEGKYEEVNEAFAHILGFESPRQMMDNVKDISKLYKFPQDRDRVLKELSKKGQVENFEVLFNHANEETVWISINAKLQKYPDGKIFYEGTIQDVTGKKLAEERLKSNEQFLSNLFQIIPLGISTFKNRTFNYLNDHLCEITGYSKDELFNQKSKIVFPTKDEYEKVGKLEKEQLDEKGISKVETKFLRKDGKLIDILIQSCYNYINDSKKEVVSAALDITEQKESEKQMKLNERRLESLLRIAQKTTSSVQELLDFALHEAIDLTASKIGYIYFYDEKKRQFSLNTWSKEVMKECRVQDPQTLYNLDDTGCWGEAVRQRRPIIINDYQADHDNPIIKGTPKGHVKMKKFLTVPVIIDNKIVAVAGVANKNEDYNNSDIRQLSLLMDSVWKISERITLINELQQAKEKAEENEKKLIEAQEISHVGSWEYIVDSDTVIWSKELYNIFEHPYDLPAPKYAEQAPFYTEESFAKLDKAIQDCVRHEIPYEIELDIITSSGAVKQIISKGTVKKDANNKIIGSYGTAQDISEQKKLESELIAAKQKAEESDRLKSAFLANMSHEIRTPMNGILGFTNLLREYGLTAEQLTEYVDIIQKSGKRMMETVNDLIDISRIETGQVEMEITDLKLKEEIRSLYLFFEAEAKAKGLELKMNSNCEVEEIVLKTDRSKLNSIATNLIKNAIKYTKKGSIEIGCQSSNNNVELYVKDTGIGIPEKLQKDIFERFVQVEQGYTRNYEGAGLGLSISKAYAELLGGDLRLESEEGKGSTFYFSLPAKEIIQKNVPETINDARSSKKSALPEDLTILIAEDDDVSRYHLQVLLQNKTGKIYFAKTGNEAVENCRSKSGLDLILMDIKMPDMDGYEAARQIRTFNKTVPIIAQTAYALEGDRDKAIEAGCNEYISKPLNRNELFFLIEKLTGKKT